MGWFAPLAAAAGYKAGTVAVGYAAGVAGGHVGYAAMQNTVGRFSSIGGCIAGAPGRFFGGIIGSSAAGIGVNNAVKQARTVSTAVNEIGSLGIDLLRQQNQIKSNIVVLEKQDNSPTAPQPVEVNAVSEASEKSDTAVIGNDLEVVIEADANGDALVVSAPLEEVQGTNWKNVAFTVGKAALVIGVGATAVASGAGVFLPLATAAASAIPDVASALTEKAVNYDSLNFIDNVAVPVATQIAIGAAGALAGGYVTNKIIENAYNSRVALGEKIGTAVGSYMPDFTKGFFTSTGRVIGTIDAGRVAMAPATVEKAISAGAATRQAVETSLQIAAVIAENQEDSGAWWKTAAVIGGGLAAGAIFTAIAPEAAAVAGGVALLSVAGSFTQYVKGRVLMQTTSIT